MLRQQAADDGRCFPKRVQQAYFQSTEETASLEVDHLSSSSTFDSTFGTKDVTNDDDSQFYIRYIYFFIS